MKAERIEFVPRQFTYDGKGLIRYPLPVVGYQLGDFVTFKSSTGSGKRPWRIAHLPTRMILSFDGRTRWEAQESILEVNKQLQVSGHSVEIEDLSTAFANVTLRNVDTYFRLRSMQLVAMAAGAKLEVPLDEYLLPYKKRI